VCCHPAYCLEGENSSGTFFEGKPCFPPFQEVWARRARGRGRGELGYSSYGIPARKFLPLRMERGGALVHQGRNEQGPIHNRHTVLTSPLYYFWSQLDCS
jgi:hypothetical protein